MGPWCCPVGSQLPPPQQQGGELPVTLLLEQGRGASGRGSPSAPRRQELPAGQAWAPRAPGTTGDLKQASGGQGGSGRVQAALRPASTRSLGLEASPWSPSCAEPILSLPATRLGPRHPRAEASGVRLRWPQLQPLRPKDGAHWPALLRPALSRGGGPAPSSSIPDHSGCQPCRPLSLASSLPRDPVEGGSSKSRCLPSRAGVPPSRTTYPACRALCTQ